MNLFNWITISSRAEEFNESTWNDSNEIENPEKHGKAGNKLMKEMPEDAVAIILSFTPAHEFTNMSLVSKSFLRASESETAQITKSIPMLKQVKELFKNRAEGSKGYVSDGENSYTDNITYGKIIKEDNGKVDIIISSSLEKETADFSITESVISSKINNIGIMRQLNQMLNFNPAEYSKYSTQGFEVSILNKELDNESNNIIKAGQLFLNKLMLKNKK